MKKKGSFFIPFLLIIVLVLVYYYRAPLYNLYYNYMVPLEKKISKLDTNKYYRDYNFDYVSNTESFIAKDKQHILDIYYTILNSGMTKFKFICDKNYSNCYNDVNDIAHNQEVLSSLNNFVHPYNSFKTIKTKATEDGIIEVKIEKVYDSKMITLIDYESEKIRNELINDSMSNTEKIRKIHDYIIDKTVYDDERADKKITQYSSDTAYGVLSEGHGVCSGYTDAMMIFLEKLNIKSIKVASENHVWNYVYVNNEWLHLDLTWDDPKTDDGSSIIDDTYFLISTDKLNELTVKNNSDEHKYKTEIYG